MQGKVTGLVWASILGAGLALTGAAHAQERWTGAYGGLSFSGVKATSEVDDTSVHSYEKNAAVLGVYGGYAFGRPGSNFVWGPELAITGLPGGGSKSDADVGRSKNLGSYLVSARLRGGYAFDQTYVYGLIGLGATEGGARPRSSDGTDIVVGSALGLGAEMALSETWALRGEVTRYDFGSPKFDYGTGKRKVRTRADVLTIGLTRKF